MRIAIDASSVAVPQKTGVAKYSQRLIERLEKLDEENEYIIYHRLSRWNRRKYFYRPEKKTTKTRLFQEPFFAGNGIDVFHGPDGRLPRVRGPRLVATIHDLFSLISDEFANQKFRKKKIAQYRNTADSADRIICVSESTRRDFIRFFPEAQAKTCVIMEGVDDRFSPTPETEVKRVKEKYGIRSDYILYVGALSKRKNILRMFEAFRKAGERVEENLQFVAAGKLTYGKEAIVSYMKEHRLENEIALLGYVPDEDLPALYTGARLFLFATLYEGFGLPILEALACDTPVVTSNVSSMPEVGGEGVLTVDPSDEGQIARAIEKILTDKAAHKSSRSKLREHARSFTWDEMARRTMEVYRLVCSE